MRASMLCAVVALVAIASVFQPALPVSQASEEWNLFNANQPAVPVSQQAPVAATESAEHWQMFQVQAAAEADPAWNLFSAAPDVPTLRTDGRYWWSSTDGNWSAPRKPQNGDLVPINGLTWKCVDGRMRILESQPLQFTLPGYRTETRCIDGRCWTFWVPNR
jgi:hypothetical protein